MIITNDEVRNALEKVLKINDENSLNYLEDLIINNNASESFISHVLGSELYSPPLYKVDTFVLVNFNCLAECNWFTKESFEKISEHLCVYNKYFVAEYKEYLGVNRAYRHKAYFANPKLRELLDQIYFYFDDKHLFKTTL